MILSALFLISVCWLRCWLAQPINDREQAVKTIILNSNYSSAIRPNNPTIIGLKITLKQIVAVDEKNQIVTSSSYLFVTWTDPRLAWNNTNFALNEPISIPLKKIWLPDLYVINTADVNGYIPVSDSALALLYSNGIVIANLGLIGKVDFYF